MHTKSASNVQAGRRDALLADLHEPGFALQNSPAGHLSLEASALGISEPDWSVKYCILSWFAAVWTFNYLVRLFCKSEPTNPLCGALKFWISKCFQISFSIEESERLQMRHMARKNCGSSIIKTVLLWYSWPPLPSGWLTKSLWCWVRSNRRMCDFQSFVLRSKDTCGKREREREMPQSV